MKANLCLILAFALSACATTHPGKIGDVVAGPKQPLVISVQRESSFSDEHYTFVTFTIESKADDMERIKSTDLDFDDAEALRASVLVGKDLVAWGQANEDQMRKTRQNHKIAQLALMLGGLAFATVGSSHYDPGMALAGSAAVVGGASWSIADKIRNPKAVPDEHIYSQFSVPAEKFVRKWAVIQHAKGAQIHKMYLTVVLEDGSESKYALEIK